MTVSGNRKLRQVRAFISSSFKDMIEDREELATHAWPRLRVLCQSRQVDFVVVDLRWGITEAQSRLASFKAPKRIVFVDTLPKNPSGKLLKRQLRESHAGLFTEV